MSRICFIPHPADPPRTPGEWPERLQGDGFIDLQLKYTLDNEAVYRDNFHEEYSMYDPTESEWWAEVRED